MAQISAGFNYTPTGANSLVTAGNLNQHVNNAQLQGGAIGEQNDVTTLTGNEYTLIYNSSTGLLGKTQIKNALLTGNDIVTDSIVSQTNQLIINSQIPSQENSIMSLLAELGTINIGAKDINLGADNGSSGSFARGSMNIYARKNLDITSGEVTNLYGNVVFQNNLKLPVGTTSERPATPEEGFIRYNSTLSSAETYNGTDWGSVAAIVNSSLTSNGYVKLSNGLILQWGTHYTAMANYSVSTVTFPIPFQNACFNVQLTARAIYPTGGGATLENGIKLNGAPTTTNFSIYVNWSGNQAGAPIYPVWFAIGI